MLACPALTFADLFGTGHTKAPPISVKRRPTAKGSAATSRMEMREKVRQLLAAHRQEARLAIAYFHAPEIAAVAERLFGSSKVTATIEKDPEIEGLKSLVFSVVVSGRDPADKLVDLGLKWHEEAEKIIGDAEEFVHLSINAQ